METKDATASGYSGGLTWCLRCDVGWTGFERKCWLCKLDDKVWRWGWQNTHPIFTPANRRNDANRG